jgi:hypothetical protein
VSQSEGLDLAVATTELASELSAIRQRGIGGIDRQRSRDGKQQPLVLPVFERLLEQFPAQAGVSRQANIEALLRAELDAYEQAAPSNDAAFIRRLLFLPDGSVPLGPGSQSDLLSAARITVGLKGKVDAFRAVQNERFDQFAAFLLRDAEWATQSTVPNSEQIAELDAPVDSHRCSAVVDVPAPPSVATEQGRSNHPTDETATTSNQPKSRWRTWLIVVVVVAVIASAAVLASAHFRSHSSAHPGAPSSPTASKPATHQFRFDSLGSTASSILNVYPGVGQNAHDKQANGTFHSGDVVTAVCVTTGRRITSDPSYGETLRSSTEWVRIAAVAGVTQYASVTYGGYVGNPPPSC